MSDYACIVLVKSRELLDRNIKESAEHMDVWRVLCVPNNLCCFSILTRCSQSKHRQSVTTRNYATRSSFTNNNFLQCKNRSYVCSSFQLEYLIAEEPRKGPL